MTMTKFGVQLPEPLTLDAISAEVVRAHIKHPGREKILAALWEEMSELMHAVLQAKPQDEQDKETIQVAAMCIRLIEEHDPDFDPTAPHWSTKP